ncbi:hypothetical protein Asi03nite_11830 [Actinoplanes siamensis]|uniref:Uncharacterized protein n=1 Tax=Actinoplanes siamensis TaxID=1223317 RepID=A0A919N3E2_9ACTN|nr:hypothetical protein Asi03nite_11830 [Actinoplanes siamensis]
MTPEANRPWDGRRLLRFLTGLAVLALAVTLRLPGPAVTPAADPVQHSAAVAAPVAARAAEPESEPRLAEPAPPAAAPAPRSAAPAPAARTGVVPATGGPRAPPAR